MADPTPEKPTKRASSKNVPALKPGSTSRLRHAGGGAAPPSEPEVVASLDGREVSSVHRRMAPAAKASVGLSLRWKIVIGMSAITVLTSILIFVFVSRTAVSQLNDEIDAKGVRLVKTLISMDPRYWMYAIYQSKGERQQKVNAVLAELFGGHLGDATREELLRGNVQARSLYDLATDRLGPDKVETGRRLAATLHELLVARPNLKEDQKREIETLYSSTLQKPAWQARFRSVLDPFGGPLEPLKTDARDIGPGHDILNVIVKDVSNNSGSGAGVQAVESGLAVSYGQAGKRSISGVTVSDGFEERSGKAIRLYTRTHKVEGLGDLQFSAILSLAHIQDAEGSLRTSILLPVLIAVLLGTGIAYWLSTLITGPIQRLISDINEVSGGNLNHKTVAVSRDEVGLLAQTFNRMTTALRAAHDQEIQSKQLEHDLEIASDIQQNLVPKQMLRIPGYDIGAYYRPSRDVGGDYYDFIRVDDDHDGIIVADVSGKGLPGALVMTMARAFLRMEAERGGNTSPADTLAKANRMLAKDIKKGMFVTALYCILNKNTNEIRVASAGHNPLVVWRAASNRIQLVNPNGIALGFDKGPVFEKSAKEESLVLGHGDRIVAFTDGTVEAMDAENREFGDKRFYGLIQQLATRDSNQLLNLLVKALEDHQGNEPQSDDITIVTLRYL
jgi:serine phosphatase RsbU (regulator of sigma subunit)